MKAKGKARKKEPEPRTPSPFDELYDAMPWSEISLRENLAREIGKLRLWFKVDPKSQELLIRCDADLDRLDRDVSALASQLAKRPPATLWNCCKTVDRHYRRLKLTEAVKRAAERAGKNVPERPLEVFDRLRKSGNKLAAAFLAFYPEVSRGKRALGSVEWEKFDELFRAYQNEKRKREGKPLAAELTTTPAKARGSPELVSYAAYLEFEREDQAWTKRYWSSLAKLILWIGRFEELSLAKALERFCLIFNPLPTWKKKWPEIRKSIARDKLRERVRRHRKKESLSKSVTENGLGSS